MHNCWDCTGICDCGDAEDCFGCGCCDYDDNDDDEWDSAWDTDDIWEDDDDA